MSDDSSTEMLPIELTLVVAATRGMGIGRGGTLPWTGLRKEMAYFARVTKRLPPAADASAMNVVIMGRKTWDSIPVKFRPLKGRLNIVISRSFTASPPREITAESDAIKVGSLESAVSYIRTGTDMRIGKVFVIGGGEIYGAALELKEARRVLLTRVMTDFECDTVFPLQLLEDDGGSIATNWQRKSKDELDAWTGEAVPGGIQKENGTQYEFQMWERNE